MEISCSHCKAAFVLPDDRVPEVSKFKLNCPKCREPIIVDKGSKFDAVVAPENFPHDATVAFIFISNKLLAEKIKLYLRSKKIYISEAADLAEALDKVRINYYDIIVLEESELLKPVMDVVKKWNGIRRREVNVIIVQASCKSMQEQEAFLRGVNSVISRDDIEYLENFLAQAIDNYTYSLEPWKVAEKKLQLKS